MSCFEADCIDIACREWLEIAPRRMRHARIPARRRPASDMYYRSRACYAAWKRKHCSGKVKCTLRDSVSVYLHEFVAFSLEAQHEHERCEQL